MEDRPPQAFISHASEDKERFVEEFASRLRLAGVDAWLDKWEIRPGDSLVRRIFTDGIDNADAFVVVVSKVSVVKPWVAEELDAGVVRKIDGQCRLIAVLLDSTPVPPALRHLLYVDAERLGMEGAVAAVVDAIFEVSRRPELGRPPAYLATPPSVLSDPLDQTVFDKIVQIFRTGAFPTSEKIRSGLVESGLRDAQVDDGVRALEERNVIEVSWYAGGTYLVGRVLPRYWLLAAESSGVDIEGLSRRVLARLVNSGSVAPVDFPDDDELTIAAVIERAEAQGLVTMSRSVGGPYRAHHISQELRRLLRD